MASKVHIGAGAGFAGDRTDAAGPVVDALARREGARFLMFETLAERTLALAQLDRRRDPAAASIPRSIGSSARCSAAACGTKSGSSAISAPPIRAAAAARILALAREQGLASPARRDRGRRRPQRRAVGATSWRRGRPAARSCATRPRSSPPISISAAEPIARRARSGRGHRRDRAGGRLRAGARAADPRVRMAIRRLGPSRRRHARRPSARMRRAGHRRIFRRSAVQDGARHGRPRLPDRRDRRRRRHGRSPSPPEPAAASTG